MATLQSKKAESGELTTFSRVTIGFSAKLDQLEQITDMSCISDKVLFMKLGFLYLRSIVEVAHRPTWNCTGVFTLFDAHLLEGCA